METLIMTHTDCDGICAGAIALSMFRDAKIFFTKPVSLLSDLKNNPAGRTIILDIAITRKDAPEIIQNLADRGEVLYFDHHPLPLNVKKQHIKISLFVHDTEASASELVYRHFQKTMPQERVWLAIYGAIGDYNVETKFMKDMVNDWDYRALYFEASSLILGIKNAEFDTYDAKRKIIQALALGSNPTDIGGLVESAARAVDEEFKIYENVKKNAESYGKIGFMRNLKYFGFRGPTALFAATVTGKPVGMCIHKRRGLLDITMRQRGHLYQLNRLADAASLAVGGSGGGHPNAAGARIPGDSMEKFMGDLNRLMDSGKYNIQGVKND
jgi:RecJ-like exonuclease